MMEPLKWWDAGRLNGVEVGVRALSYKMLYDFDEVYYFLNSMMLNKQQLEEVASLFKPMEPMEPGFT